MKEHDRNLETCVERKVGRLKGELRGRPLFWSKEDPRHKVFTPVLGGETTSALARRFREILRLNLARLCRGEKVKLPFEQDRRNPVRYIYDTVDGWFLQELIRQWLEVVCRKESEHIKVETVGKDADFTFQFEKLTGKEISSSPDLKISYRLKGDQYYETYVEIQWSAGGRRSTYHIKENKVSTLCEQARGANKRGVFLWFFHHGGKGYIFVLPCEVVRNMAKRVPRHPPFGWKPVFEISEQFVQAYRFGYFSLKREPNPRLKELLRPEEGGSP